MKLLTRKMNLIKEGALYYLLFFFKEIMKEHLKLFYFIVGFRNTTNHKPSMIVTESKRCHPIAFKI